MNNKNFTSLDIANSYPNHNNKFKSIYPLLLLISIALMGSEGCAVKQPPAIEDTTSNAATQANSTEPTEFRITSTEFNYNPNKIKVKEGQTVTLTLDNRQGAIEHDFCIKELGVRLTAKSGQVTSQTLIGKKPGHYEYNCSLPGHQDSGMSGELIIEPSDLTATPAHPDDDNLHADAVKIPDLPRGISHLPARKAAPPLIRRKPGFVQIELEAVPVTALLTENIGYNYWTFNGTVPGPMIRLRQGDTVELTLKNSPSSPVTHSIDSHGITGPGGGAKFTQTAPGDSSILRFKAIKPGAYVYHCATTSVPHHISNGMYGLMVVEPPRGWPKVDHEFYVMQGDLYLKGKPDQSGIHDVSIHKLNKEEPDYVVFNGSVGSLSEQNVLKAKVGETVRIFFGVGGPNVTSSFHIIGEMFDKVYTGGNPYESISNVQTVMVPAGGSAIVDLKLDVPGTYILVDHSLSRLQKGAAGFLVVEGPENPNVFQPVVGFLFNQSRLNPQRKLPASLKSLL